MARESSRTRSRIWARPRHVAGTIGRWPRRPRNRSQALADFALKGLSRLDAGTESALIEEAAALGISSERADRLIGRMCRRSGVRRELGSVTPLAARPARPNLRDAGQCERCGQVSLLRCRQCAGVTELSPVARKADTARCRHCGSSLKWDCPVCKRSGLGRRTAMRMWLSAGDA